MAENVGKMAEKWSPLSVEWHRMSQSAGKRQKMAEKRQKNGEKVRRCQGNGAGCRKVTFWQAGGDAVYAAEELARLHRKYSPVAHLFAEEEGG
jgi:hypothetical protein